VTRLLRFVEEHYLVVPIGAVVAIVWANTAAPSYFQTARALAFVVNDIGMAFALAFLAQEVVEATLPGGTLHPWQRTALPIVAAAGGMVGAAATYKAYVLSGDQTNLLPGWPIACAVDVAFCYFVAASVFMRGAAVTFLLLLAIASDAIGLVIVSYRYPVMTVHPEAAALIIPAIWIAAVLRKNRVGTVWPYILVSGTLSWLAFYWSGVHPALALLPIVPFFPHAARDLNPLADPAQGRHKAAAHFEAVFNYPVQAIGFLFGLVNAGVSIKGFDDGTWAIVVASLVGRPLGILIATGLAVTAGLDVPRRLGWRDVLVVALSASPGFTFGLFFATAVFPVGDVLNQVKMGAMWTVAGALLAVGAARLLRVGRFAPLA
jgi:Na+:H+ antiporter, NhaA family